MDKESMSWLESQKEYLNKRRAEIDNIEVLIEKISVPVTNKLEAIERLKNLLEWWGIIPQHGPFQTESIMEDLLMDQDYQVKSHPDSRDSYIVGNFELKLIPSSKVLKVEYIDIAKKNKHMPWPEDNRYDEYDIITQNRGLFKRASLLSKLSFKKDEIQPTFIERTKRIQNNLMSLKFSNRIDEICSNFSSFVSELKDEEERIRERDNREIAQSLIALKNSGLFETLELISKETKCFVNFDIFIGKYSYDNGIAEANDFIEKYGTIDLYHQS